MKMMFLFISFFAGTSMQFSTLANGESLTLIDGINYASIECVDCDIVHAGATMNLVNGVFTFQDYAGQFYNEIVINSNADGTKIAYRYEQY